MVGDDKCAGCGKQGCDTQCPTCRQCGLIPVPRFCSQDCFKANWKSHKSVHAEPQAAIKKDGFWLNVTKPGDGKTFPAKGDTIVMSYKGHLTDGSVFDASDSFETQIGVGQLIGGWDEAVPRMSLGEEATLVCSPEKGYGARGAGTTIPPNSTLVFYVGLKEIKGRS
eukprot:NODE_1777_length_741_cov_174.820847_g1727_i0.p1 GENE.NODE_1777_length_741_cov_174.820847_g1727_i0~~NODE_1777_length_741_cov_174.820847_g1727_i0.p1  ORF type:complete len:167 (-),score=20.68 NODE_1777_length_741_cov_174.820847_g1727_i0:172-672(-)